MDYIAEVNALIGGLALYPQLYKAVQTHDVADLSTATFFILFCTNIVWSLYGIHRKDPAILCSSCLVLIASGALLTLKILWS